MHITFKLVDSLAGGVEVVLCLLVLLPKLADLLARALHLLAHLVQSTLPLARQLLLRVRTGSI